MINYIMTRTGLHDKCKYTIWVPQSKPSDREGSPVMANEDLCHAFRQEQNKTLGVLLTAFLIPRASSRAAKSAHSFLVEYSAGSTGLEVPP